jgi:hypothetical protein
LGIEAILPLIIGGFLTALGILPTNLPYAFLLEWMGALVAFTGISRLSTKLALTLSFSAFIIGGTGDSLLIRAPNPLGWTLTNYMVFIHALTGAMAGKLLKRN